MVNMLGVCFSAWEEVSREVAGRTWGLAGWTSRPPLPTTPTSHLTSSMLCRPDDLATQCLWPTWGHSHKQFLTVASHDWSCWLKMVVSLLFFSWISKWAGRSWRRCLAWQVWWNEQMSRKIKTERVVGWEQWLSSSRWRLCRPFVSFKTEH